MMNVIEAAQRVGLQLRTLQEAREFVDAYAELERSLAPDLLKTFRDAARGMSNFFSFPYALALLEANNGRTDLPKPFHDEIRQLIKSPEVQKLCRLSTVLAENLDLMIVASMSPNIAPQTFGHLATSIKLRRAIQDLRFTLQRTRVIPQLITYVEQKTGHLPDIVERFEDQRRLYTHPLSRDIRLIIREMATNGTENQLLTTAYVMGVTLDLAKQMIFESCLQEVFELPETGVDAISMRQVRRVRGISVRLNTALMSIMNWHGNFARIRINGVTETAIITRRHLRWGQSAPHEYRLRVSGYLYPTSDVDVASKLY